MAHVDSGKTTLSEAILFRTGVLKSLGRVDHKDAFFDSDSQERDRGITIRSKQAQFSVGQNEITLLDTPGHIDFSAEMERALRVLDYAILVINVRDGVTKHTKAMWSLLKEYKVPVIVFVNKMDLAGASKIEAMQEIKAELSALCVDFASEKESDKEAFYEEVALCDESLLDEMLDTGGIADERINKAIFARKIFPCYFGSALKLDGVDELLGGIEKLHIQTDYTEDFGGRVYKISRDEKGVRLTHLKITGGSLSVRQLVQTGESLEKINQIRLYSGDKFDVLDEAEAGMVVAVTGWDNTYSGQCLGAETFDKPSGLELGKIYEVGYPVGTNTFKLIQHIGQLEEEFPELQLYVTDEQKILIRIIGPVQLEVVQELIKDRYETPVLLSEYIPPEPEEEPEDEVEEIDDRVDLNARWLPGQEAQGSISEEELEHIFEKTYGKIKDRNPRHERAIPSELRIDSLNKETEIEYLILDGYNVIFAWDDLREIAQDNLPTARDMLIDMMSNYKSMVNSEVIIVFDAYKIKGGERSVENYGGIYVVYTEEAESADTYIEKITYQMKSKYRVRVVSSDNAEQTIVLGNKARPVRAQTFRKEYDAVNESIQQWLKEHKLRMDIENHNNITIKKK
ncbi:MAG: GTP-binding protein [Clostridiales bacterium]|nr:GTP-binding protein [Clostridiales bacterium]